MVSALIPTLNRPSLAREALASALEQDVVDLEVIVGDDGDQAEEVVAEFDDRRARYVRHDPPHGIAQNWNRLLDAARGEFVALLMDDDRWLPSFLSACLMEFRENPELGVVFTNHFFVAGSQRWVRESRLRAGTYRDFAERFVATRPVAVSAAVVRKSAWADVRPLPETAAADMVLFGRLADRGWPFAYVDQPLMEYRLHAENFSGRQVFRDDIVRAWEALSFRDPDAEALRRQRLAAALVARATQRLRSGQRTQARSDARAAADLGAGATRARIIEALSRVPGGTAAARLASTICGICHRGGRAPQRTASQRRRYRGTT